MEDKKSTIEKVDEAIGKAPPEMAGRMYVFLTIGLLVIILSFILSVLGARMAAVLVLFGAFALIGGGCIYAYIIIFEKWTKVEGVCEGIEKANVIVRTLERGSNVIVREKETGKLFMLRGRRNKIAYKEGTEVLAIISKDGYDKNGIVVPSGIYVFKVLRR